MGKHKLWTVVDDNYIIANYSKKTATQLASKLNTTQNAVYGRVKKLGLSKETKLDNPVQLKAPKTKQIVVDNKKLQSVEFDIQGVKIHMVFK